MPRTLCLLSVMVLMSWAAVHAIAQERSPLIPNNSALAGIQSMSPDDLEFAADQAFGLDLEVILHEMIRRGDERYVDYIKRRIKKLERTGLPGGSSDSAIEARRIGEPTFELWTAMRRLQGEHDPFRMIVVGRRTKRAEVGRLPFFNVILVNFDAERKDIPIQAFKQMDQGFYARWRFEVHDETGTRIELIDMPELEGFSKHGWDALQYGESWAGSLDMNKVVPSLAPGKYKLVIQYHNRAPIVNQATLKGLIYIESEPIELNVEPIIVKATWQELSTAKAAVAQLPDKPPIKIHGGAYTKHSYAFIAPETPAGRILQIGWPAVPPLLDLVLDDMAPTHKRAWGLGLLYSITGRHDPREADDVLGPYRYRHSGWEWLDADKSRLVARRGNEPENEPHRVAMPDAQDTFAERWRIWQTGRFVRINDPEEETLPGMP